MMVLHSPNNRESRPHIIEMEDSGDTLRVKKELQQTGLYCNFDIKKIP